MEKQEKQEKQEMIDKLIEKESCLWDELQNLISKYGMDNQITIDKSFQWYEISVQLEELGVIL